MRLGLKLIVEEETPCWLQKMLLLPRLGIPCSGGRRSAEIRRYQNAMASQQQAIDHGFTCASAGIFSNGSNMETPRECGGWAPNF